MTDEAQGPERVGVRELRQNLSVYLDRVKDGETLEVTEHGHAVALLTPLPRATRSTLERLVAEGRVTPGSGDLVAYLRANPTVPPSTAPVAAPPAAAGPPAAAPPAAAGPPAPADTVPAVHDPEPTMTEILHRMQEEADR
jgi:prevent-host-death family protein